MKRLDDGLKQRLIGAVILLALGVIFIPVLFDRDPIKPVDRETQIPPEPEIVTIEIQEPEPPPQTELAPPPEQMYQPQNMTEASAEVEAPGLTEQGVPKSWVLQVGSFASQDAAEALRKALAAQDYAAYTRQVSLDAKTVTRVLVGPKLDKAALLQDKEKIDQEHDVSSILLEFTPE